LIVTLRNFLYNRRIFPIKRLDRPVISVGNITAGGSGKTPLVEFICRELMERGLKPAILSRGYNRSSKKDIIFISPPGSGIDSETIGDEPFMMARRLNGAAFGIGGNRHRTGTGLLKRYNPDFFILDDGFQHRSLHRDIDIVILNGNRPFYNGWCLPAGMLREPPGSLSRADLIVVRGSAINEEIIKFAAGKEIINVSVLPDGLKSIPGNKPLPVSNLKGKKVIAFCGIGDPDGFRRMILGSGAELRYFKSYRDHYRYTERDIAGLKEKYRSSGGEMALTTAKDAVKLMKFKIDFPLYSLDIKYYFEIRDEDLLLSSIVDKINR
jgi:tetraacyldisaccharide 4'-kinase